MIATLTGAWSRLPVAAGSVGTASTWIVDPPCPEDATLLTYEIRPGVVWLSGSVMLTASPTSTSPCRAASSSIVTWRAVELTVSTGPAMTPEPMPTLAITAVTRTGPDSNATEPSSSSPVTLSPRAACRARIAVAVAGVNASPVRPGP